MSKLSIYFFYFFFLGGGYLQMKTLKFWDHFQDSLKIINMWWNFFYIEKDVDAVMDIVQIQVQLYMPSVNRHLGPRHIRTELYSVPLKTEYVFGTSQS
jgi:hypothetical protein